MKKRSFWKATWNVVRKAGRGAAASAQWINRQRKTIQRPSAEPKYHSFNDLQMLDGELCTFEHKMLTSKSLIGIILGARGTGKSALGLRLLENIRAKKKRIVYALGFAAESLPKWIIAVDSIAKIKNNGVVLVDEGGIIFSSRKSMTSANQLLSELLLIARHKDLSIYFISQNSSNLEVNTLRQADFLLLKPSSLLQKDFERKKIKELYQEVHDHFQKHKSTPGATYIYSDWYRGFASNDLPSFWNENVSKSWK